MQSIREKVKEQLAFDSEVKVIRVIDKLLNYAIGAEAAEICFEPEENSLEVIFRLAGGMENIFSIPKKMEPAVISGLKEMAGIPGSAENTALNGKFKKDYQGFKIVFSLAMHPTASGEKITIDLRKENFEPLPIGRLGFNAPALAAVKKNLNKRKGLTLVIGNYDSGRTTTLYSFLEFINKPELNMATLESDIPFVIPQINQSRLNPLSGYSSAIAANSLRRRDIDVAMIAEINDQATAEAAFHLAESGRFILGGLYSRDAGTAMSFFRDLSVPLPLVTSAVKMMITEKLLKKNCPHCLVEQKISAGARQKLKERFALTGLLQKMRADKIISEKISGPKDLVFYKSRGCSCCDQTGFSGKIGAFEVLEITPEVKKIIKEGHFPAIRREAKKQGSYLLEEDALAKALNGSVAIEEVFRVME